MNAQALRVLLTKRRAAVAPESHGLRRPTGKGRRAPGLAQHQVDQLLNRGPGTYQRLESGKYRNPPVDLLHDLALLLRLSELEWVALCRYAGIGDPPCPLNPRSGEQVPNLWNDAVEGISHAACVIDASWNVLAHNPPFADFFPVGQCPANMMRWMLFDGRHVLDEWYTAWAPHVLSTLRADLAARPEDDVLLRIEAAVRADFTAAQLYESAGAVVHPYEQARPLTHARYGPGRVNMCVAQPLSCPGARLFIFLFEPEAQHPPRPAADRVRDLRRNRVPEPVRAASDRMRSAILAPIGSI
ncbi:XRE family transcriptional regulator [Streptomyces palmae]|uniref:MmyB family transcriptional regulator n=1 Tax=Streptomyces palmae TaxID=1701085 RepID=UPI001432DD9A|nr:XRE family transcriptional regulator [Streptomyces palmae]